jgi:hypothetical protein
LPHILPDDGLIEGKLVRLMLFDKFLQIPLFSPLSDNDKFIIMDERIDVFYYIGVVEGLHQIDFFQAFLTLLLVCHIEDLF